MTSLTHELYVSYATLKLLNGLQRITRREERGERKEKDFEGTLKL
jgi:hypothetical protein